MRITAARAMAYAGDLAINEPNDSFEREADKTADAVMRDSSNSETEANRVASFEDVRIHTDAKSTESARAVNALAYTVGNHVVFAEGQYAPSEPRGLRLLAHELTHVMQLGRTQSASQAQVRRQAAPPAAGPPAPAPAMPLSDAMLRQIAQRLRKAMEGWGTDEEAIYSSLSGRTQAEVDEIAKVYQREYKRSLIDDLKDELSDSELKHLAIFAPNAVEKFGSTPQQQQASRAEIVARQLQKAMEGWGTDESSIFAALTGRSETERQDIRNAYKNLTKHDLEADLRDELSGSDLIQALALLRQGLLLPEDKIKLAVKGLGTDEDLLFEGLNEITGDRGRIKDTIDHYAAKGYGDMLDDIRDDLSGSDLARAMELLHGQTPSGTCSTDERKIGLEAISGAVTLAQNAVAVLGVDVAANRLSSNVKDSLDKNFNPGNAPNAVNVALANQVRTVLDRARTDLLMVSSVTCGAPSPCVAKPSCDQFTYGWTHKPAGSVVALCPAFFQCLGDSDRPKGMLHEFVHHTGVTDKFYVYQAGYSTLQPLGNQAANDSLDNADSFATLAGDLS
ncbi:MAG TPA: DUF4157 domain-containing protein [Candidatus Acidoferrum sp.]|nr:DUF4157 domain-containing protein [Candidatus Acidoferrum sp.]